VYNRISDTFFGGIRERIVGVHQEDHLKHTGEQEEDKDDHQDEFDHCLAALPEA